MTRGRLFEWRTDITRGGPPSRPAHISWADHLEWLRRTLGRSGATLLIAEDRTGRALGQVRFDLDAAADGDAEISVGIAPEARGRGSARPSWMPGWSCSSGRPGQLGTGADQGGKRRFRCDTSCRADFDRAGSEVRGAEAILYSRRRDATASEIRIRSTPSGPASRVRHRGAVGEPRARAVARDRARRTSRPRAAPTRSSSRPTRPTAMTLDVDRPAFRVGGGTLWDGRTPPRLYAEAHDAVGVARAIFRAAHEAGIDLFSTPFDPSAVDFLEDSASPAFKIASFELLDLDLIRYAASKRRPLIMSTGMATRRRRSTTRCRRPRTAAPRRDPLLRCNSAIRRPAARWTCGRSPTCTERWRGADRAVRPHAHRSRPRCRARRWARACSRST